MNSVREGVRKKEEGEGRWEGRELEQLQKKQKASPGRLGEGVLYWLEGERQAAAQRAGRENQAQT